MLTPDCKCISRPVRDWPWSTGFPLQLERPCHIAQERRSFRSRLPGWTVVHAGVRRLNSVWKAIMAGDWWPSPVRRDEREGPHHLGRSWHPEWDMWHGPSYLHWWGDATHSALTAQGEPEQRLPRRGQAGSSSQGTDPTEGRGKQWGGGGRTRAELRLRQLGEWRNFPSRDEMLHGWNGPSGLRAWKASWRRSGIHWGRTEWIGALC